jgi:hypothetical protein
MNMLVTTAIAIIALFVLLGIGGLFSGGRKNDVPQDHPQQEAETEIVSTPDDLLAAINSLQSRISRTHFIVRVDARGWIWEDVQNARWLRAHTPHARVQVDYIKLPSLPRAVRSR